MCYSFKGKINVIDKRHNTWNSGSEVNILDLMPVAQAIGELDSAVGVNSNGVVNVLGLVQIANRIWLRG